MSEVTNDAKAGWINRVLGVAIQAGGGSGFPVLDGRAKDTQARAGWQVARAQAIAALSSLEATVGRDDHRNRDRAVILLRSIRANLTEMPISLRQIAALESYLSTDDIVAAAEVPNRFGIPIALRRPLLAALAALRS